MSLSMILVYLKSLTMWFPGYFSDFGDTEVSTLVDHFREALGTAADNIEIYWSKFKKDLYHR